MPKFAPLLSGHISIPGSPTKGLAQSADSIPIESKGSACCIPPASDNEGSRGAVRDREERPICRPVDSSFCLHPKAFVFLDRSTGTKRFEVNPGSDGSLPVEEAINLLAMPCVVRGQLPGISA